MPATSIRRLALRSAAAAVVAVLSLGACTSSPPPSQTPPTALPSTSASASSAPSSPNPATLTIVGSGDILLHPQLWNQARSDAKAAGSSGYDFTPLLAGVAGVVSAADLAVCHMETPLAPAAGPFVGYPGFSVPPQIAKALAKTGYDTCSTASNHTLDQGEAGVIRTLNALDAAGIKHAGSYRSADAHGTVNMLDVHGVKIAQLSYAYGFNGQTRPAGKTWIANLLNVDDVLAEAKRARKAGAEIVIVSLHFGTEYQHAPNAQQLSAAKKLLASPDVDLILGHHAHVVQPFEKIGTKWVAYGMGNEVAHHAQPVNDNREGVLSRFTFTKVSAGRWQVTLAEAIPVWMDFSPDRLVNIPEALAGNKISASERSTLTAALERIKKYLYSRGADDDGLKVLG